MKASTAHRFITDPEVVEMFDQERASIFEEFSKTAPDDQGALVRLRLKLDCLDGLRSKMTSLAHDFARSRN